VAASKSTPVSVVERCLTALEPRVALVESAPLTEGTRKPSRFFTLDLGERGKRTSVGQFALIDEQELVGRKVIVCCASEPRKMGPYRSEVLVLGTAHPESPPDQAQAVPIYAHSTATPGDLLF